MWIYGVQVAAAAVAGLVAAVALPLVAEATTEF